MRATYLTHDDVNATLARRFAARRQVELLVNDCRQQLMTSYLICDLDHLPAEAATWLLHRAERGEDLSRVAVHSYNLRPAQIRLLRGAGALVCRRLRRRLFEVYRLKVA